MKMRFLFLLCFLFSCLIFSYAQDPVLKIELILQKNGKEIKASPDYHVTLEGQLEHKHLNGSFIINDQGHYYFGKLARYRCQPLTITITRGEKQMSVLFKPDICRKYDGYQECFELKIPFRKGFFKVTDFKGEKPDGGVYLWKSKKLRRQ
jgi:hypothetical protein